MIETFHKEKYQKLIELIFLDYHNQPSLFKIISPNEFKEYKKSYENRIRTNSVDGGKTIKIFKKKANNNLISDFFTDLKIVRNSPYFFIKEVKNNNKYRKTIRKYILNSEFFFDYAKKELKQNDFTEKEKNWIAYYLNNPVMRKFILKNYKKQKNIIQKITYFLLDFCVISEISFYHRFFNETLNHYQELLKLEGKEKRELIMWILGEYRTFGSDEEQVITRKNIGKKVLLLFDFNENLVKEFPGFF